MPSHTQRTAGGKSNGGDSEARGSDSEAVGANGKGTSAARDASLATRLGPIEIDWPRSLGFFGGVSLAVCAGVIEPPLGVFIAAVPFIKMLDLPALPNQLKFVAQIFEGASKPIGGDSQGTIRLITRKGASDEPVQSNN